MTIIYKRLYIFNLTLINFYSYVVSFLIAYILKITVLRYFKCCKNAALNFAKFIENSQ